MNEEEKLALVDTLEKLDDSVIGNQGAINAMRYVIQCLCANLPAADAASIQKRLQIARDDLAEAVDPVSSAVVKELASFEMALSGTATSILH